MRGEREWVEGLDCLMYLLRCQAGVRFLRVTMATRLSVTSLERTEGWK